MCIKLVYIFSPLDILLVDLQIKGLNVQNALFPTDIQDYFTIQTQTIIKLDSHTISKQTLKEFCNVLLHGRTQDFQ